MKSSIQNRFSWAIMIFRVVQILLIIGILLQFTHLLEGPEAGFSMLIYLAIFIVSIVGRKKVLGIIEEEVGREVQEISDVKSKMFSNAQIPVVALEDVGTIKWHNAAFSEMCNTEALIGMNIKSILSEIKMQDFIAAKQVENKIIKIGKKQYSVSAECILGENGKRNQFVFYFIDCTENAALKEQITEERCMMGYLCIDNIDEILPILSFFGYSIFWNISIHISYNYR